MDRNTFYDSLRYYQEHDINSLQHHGIKGQKWGIRRYQNPDGSLTEEGKLRYLNSDGTLNDRAPNKIKRAYVAYQQNQRVKDVESGKAFEDDYVYNKEKQAEKLNNAKNNKMYDRGFVEAIQNVEDLTDDECNKEYEKYLKNPNRYLDEFDADAYNREKNHDDMFKELAKARTADGKPDLDAMQKIFDNYKNKPMPESDPNMRGYEEEKDRQMLERVKNAREQSQNTENKKPEKHKLTKEEKKEAKAAQKQVEKNLKGGIIGNWALLNQAIKEAGITDTKNMTAADWNKVNEEIKKLRK